MRRGARDGVKELEASLGVRLFNRTSRQFAMTEVGQEFYQYAMALMRSAELAEEAMRQRLAEPSGVIRVTTAADIAQFALRHSPIGAHQGDGKRGLGGGDGLTDQSFWCPVMGYQYSMFVQPALQFMEQLGAARLTRQTFLEPARNIAALMLSYRTEAEGLVPRCESSRPRSKRWPRMRC